jgi:predicted transcriptional regulator
MVVTLYVAGYSNKEIADELGYTTQRVVQILKDPRAEKKTQKALSKLADNTTDVIERFRLYSNEALTTHVDIMRDSPKDDLRLKAAQNILDRAGHTPIQKKVELKGEIPADPALLARLNEALSDLEEHGINYEIPEAEFEVIDGGTSADPTPPPPALESGSADADQSERSER